MHGEISAATILGVSLIALAALIGIAVLVFGTSKDALNEGATDLVIALDDVEVVQLKSEFDNKLTTGSLAMKSINKYCNKGNYMTLFVATKKYLDKQEEIESEFIVPVYMTDYSDFVYRDSGDPEQYEMYGAVIDLYTDSENPGILIENGEHIFKGGYLYIEESNQYAFRQLDDLKNMASDQYINPKSKFKSRLVYDVSGSIIGFILNEV